MKGNTGLIPSKRKHHELDVVSNQWQSSPKHALFLEYYFVPTSNTFGNAYKSGVKAGFSESYSRTLTRKTDKHMWLAEFINSTQLTQDHVIAGITNIALNSEKDSNKLKALELLAKLQGMMVDRKITAHVNIEQALQNLR